MNNPVERKNFMKPLIEMWSNFAWKEYVILLAMLGGGAAVGAGFIEAVANEAISLSLLGGAAVLVSGASLGINETIHSNDRPRDTV